MRKAHREATLLLSAPRVPCSMFSSAPGDGGTKLKSVISDVTSGKSEVTSELKPEPGSDPTHLGSCNS